MITIGQRARWNNWDAKIHLENYDSAYVAVSSKIDPLIMKRFESTA